MALPRNLQQAYSLGELELLTGSSEEVTIRPTFAMPKLELLGGTVGPFQPPRTLKVPLWLACTLKRRNRCHIVPPDWLTIAHLDKASEFEELNHYRFSENLPFRFMEIAHMLIECASDDIPDAQHLWRIIQDLREMRQSKAREGLKDLDARYLQMDGLSSFEINEVRPVFSKVFNEQVKIEKTRTS
ncbi:Psf2-domain-containing protein [Ramicandelaber brevisporus]|nr:Psf2-domain-containing protein [Ramicandelaber brevisporus]